MIDIEEQLRQELRTIAERAKPDSIRPLRVPPPRRKSRTVRWLAPVAAAAAVAGLIAGLTVAGNTTQRLSSLPPGTPKYYVTLNSARQAGTYVVRAVVRASATGVPISSVQLLRSRNFVQPLAITGAANDRAFLITVPGILEILRIAADGHVLGGLARVPRNIWDLSIYSATGTSDVLSPDGTEVVVPIYEPFGTGRVAKPCSSCAHGVAMYSVRSGVTTKWLLAKGDKDVFLPVNWLGDGHTVLLSGGSGPYRLLDVSHPGGSLLASSRSIRVPAPPRDWISGSPVLLPDGKTFLNGFTQSSETHPGNTVEMTARARILETSAGSASWGSEIYAFTIRTRANIGLGCYPESLGPTQVHVLMVCLNRFGRLDGSHFTPLPGPRGALTGPGAAW